MLISGLIGFFALRHGFGPAPFVMGLVLGGQIEKSWSQSMIIFDSNWLRFFDSPICLVFYALPAISLAGPAIGPPLGRSSAERRDGNEGVSTCRSRWETFH